ncbi:FAD binding domain-containing protein [Paraburkholderia susongensis]|uniref:2-polyprenyl-6-methoxyphenol hydroxylase n=1 Tax=Paraburkholderia susongensis TaxID=1515439 RepID=A0A1X7M419_9BURK|nr:FAD binding domain-containing protein [Paraburkholderia susongensis]SMG60447.1 2-polyprenyl-6-methoxyphenol hydroxylase [Paraburkholderia susongensis]
MKIIIAGGSIAGLAAALTLDCTGHEVEIYERSATPLRGQGGGVAVLRRMMAFLEQHGHHCRETISVPTHRRRWIDRDGALTRDEPEMLPFSSWDAVYRSLCSMLPRERIRYGQAITGFHQDSEYVDVRIDGRTVRADVLIAADGTGSGLRSQLFPGYTPSFAGYIAWRGIIDEADFDAETIATLVENMTLHKAPGELFMAFLIPALDGSLTPGTRRFNWLWYRNEADTQALRRHLTDRAGTVHHASIHPGQLSDDSVSTLRRLASERLPSVFAQLVLATRAPFVQAIFDALSPDFAVGRVVLTGDAACTVRPHTASGTSKAAHDAVSLAQALSPDATDVVQRLAAWSTQRRAEVTSLLEKGPQLAASFGLGKPWRTDD